MSLRPFPTACRLRRPFAAALVCLLVPWSPLGCTETVRRPARLTSFEVTFAGADGAATGSTDAPLPYVNGAPCSLDAECDEPLRCVDGACAGLRTLNVVAVDETGAPVDFEGWVGLRVTPGVLAPSSAHSPIAGGSTGGIDVWFSRAIGPTLLWVEDDGFVPAQGRPAACADGVDSDGDGLVDMADPGCLEPDDDDETNPSGAAGASPTLYFANPRIRDVQHTPQLNHSPLEDQQVRITGGHMVVTNVVANGFYVVDLDDQRPGRYYNGIFVFTFSKPRHVRLGDVVCELDGAVTEFVGTTQLAFPSFEVLYASNPRCNANTPGVDPHLEPPKPLRLTDKLLDELTGASPPLPLDEATGPTHRCDFDGNGELQGAQEAACHNNSYLEAFESNLVWFDDVDVSETFVACDRNANGFIDPGAESDCRDQCQRDPLCTDLESFFQYAQWAGRVAGRKKMYASAALADRFNPLRIDTPGQPDGNGLCKLDPQDGFIRYTCPPRHLLHLSGSLRHIYLCGDDSDDARCNLQFWVVDPRFDGDVVMPDDVDQDGDGLTPAEGDCDDDSPLVHPGAKERPLNGIDDDCDGATDE